MAKFNPHPVLMQNVKKTNPGISFTDVGKVLGERWNKMTGWYNLNMRLIVQWLTLALTLPELVFQLRRKHHMKQKLEQTRNATLTRSVTTRIHRP